MVIRLWVLLFHFWILFLFTACIPNDASFIFIILLQSHIKIIKFVIMILLQFFCAYLNFFFLFCSLFHLFTCTFNTIVLAVLLSIHLTGQPTSNLIQCVDRYSRSKENETIDYEQFLFFFEYHSHENFLYTHMCTLICLP